MNTKVDTGTANCHIANPESETLKEKVWYCLFTVFKSLGYYTIGLGLGAFTVNVFAPIYLNTEAIFTSRLASM